MTKVKKGFKSLLSIFLCMLVILSIFSCNIIARAEAIAMTTAGLCVLATGLLACGIVLTSDKGFRQACVDAWEQTTDRIKNTIVGVATVLDVGGHLVAKWASDKWKEFTDYVTDTYSPTETTEISSATTGVADIVLTDGTVLKGNPNLGELKKCFIWKDLTDNTFKMLELNSETASAVLSGQTVTLYSRQGGAVAFHKYVNSEWIAGNTYNLNPRQYYQNSYDWYGRALTVSMSKNNIEGILFTSIPFTYSTGTPQLGASEIPETSSGYSYAVPDSIYYPGAGVLAPPVSIPAGGSIGITIPTTYDNTTGQDVIDLGKIGTMNPADVKTKVGDVVIGKDETVVESKDIAISDTIVGDITASDTTDQDTANKFKLPRIALTKFPFCIPYDLYNAVSVLQAPAECPKWTIPFKIPSLNINESITIDFQKFDSIAVICRWFFSAIWIVVLILITRRLIFS